MQTGVWRALSRSGLVTAAFLSILAACQKAGPTENMNGSDTSDLPQAPAYGQYPPSDLGGDLSKGPGSPNPGLPPASSGEQPSAAGMPDGEEDPGEEVEELGLPVNFDYQPIVRNWPSNVGPFNPIRWLPDPRILNQFYCWVVERAGTGLGDRYDFILGAVLDLYGRVPDTGLAVELLGILTNTYDENGRHAVVSRIIHSTEFRTRLVQVYFASFVERMPTAAETAVYVGQLAEGKTWEDVMANIMMSQPFYDKHVGRTRDHTAKMRKFVNAVYRKVAGRNPKGWERNRGVRFMSRNGGISSAARRAFAVRTLGQPEVLAKFIEFSYVIYLGKAPSPSELRDWLQKMQRGHHRMLVVKSLLSSLDYLNVQRNRFQSWTDDGYCR